jgi:hypothetical protein
MAFIRTKRVKGILYGYRVESYRQGGKVRQRVLSYLGRVADAPKAKKQKKKEKTAKPHRAKEKAVPAGKAKLKKRKQRK